MADKTSESLFLLGSDPELVFTTEEGDIVPACEYLNTHNDAPNDKLGCDGTHGPSRFVAEARPDPGTPEQLVENMRQIFREYMPQIPQHALWRAGSWVSDMPIGAHIHFSLPFEDKYGILLDGVLSQFLTLLEDERQARRRRAGPFGALFQYAMEDQAVRHRHNHRGFAHAGFEYRPPGSFIFSSWMSRGVFALAKAIIYEEVVKGPMRLDRLKGDLLVCVTKVDAQAYRDCDTKYFMNKLDRLWGLIGRYSFWGTDEGKRLWRYVAQIYNRIGKGTWDNGYDILHRWKLLKRTTTTNKRTQAAAVNIPHFAGADVMWQILNDAPLGEMRVEQPRDPRGRFVARREAREQVRIGVIGGEIGVIEGERRLVFDRAGNVNF